MWGYSMILGVARSNDCQARSGSGVTNGIRADPHGFTDAYGLVKKDTIAYVSGTWVHTHDALVLWEVHGMVRMLLNRRMIPVCQYWMYGRYQEGTLLAWG
jgi:hypothetical protein